MNAPIRIAHIVNVTEINASKHASYLHIAQPVTLKSMVKAAELARPVADVELFAIKHRSEQVSIPDGIRWASDIQQYGWEFFDELQGLDKQKPLPRIKDIVDGLYAASDADYFIYTNLDIGLQPDFYIAVAELIQQGFDAFCINRRTLPTHFHDILLTEQNLELIYRLNGEIHGGIDCFVFRKDVALRLDLGNVFLGFPPVGQVLKTQIERQARNFTWVKDRLLTFHLGDDRVWDVSKSPYSEANRKAAVGRFEGSFGDYAGQRRQPAWKQMAKKLHGLLS